MRALIVFVCCLAVPASAFGDKRPPSPAPSQPAAKRPPADPADAVRTTVLRHAEAIEKRDLAALDTLYADDPELLVIENSGADKSWKAYRDHHLAPELAEVKDLRYRYANVRVDVDAALAWATFEYELHAVIKDKPLDVVGRGTMVLRRKGDAWKIVHSHTSGKAR